MGDLEQAAHIEVCAGCRHDLVIRGTWEHVRPGIDDEQCPSPSPMDCRPVDSLVTDVTDGSRV